MITYRKGCAGLFVLFRLAGTSWSSGILPGLTSACIGLACGRLGDLDATILDGDKFIQNVYPFQFFAYVLGLLTVFRTNFAYHRYWEALDALQRMGAKWFDCACMAVAFDAPGDVSQPYLFGRGDLELPEHGKKAGCSHSDFFREVVHLFSLLHALALQHLRCDPDLGNLEAHGTVRMTKLVAPPPSTKLHRNRVACFGAFSERSWRSELRARKLKILGGLAPGELRLLEEIDKKAQEPTLTRVAMLQSWIMRRLIARQKYEPRGDSARTSPPILSRLYQVISDGHLGFSQAAKVSETPFPFPYQNLLRLLLWIFTFSVPFVINSQVVHHVARFAMNFLAVWAYFALCEVGDNLEDPFLPYDANELPLQAIQHAFNAKLLSLQVVPRHSGGDPAEPEAGPQRPVEPSGAKPEQGAFNGVGVAEPGEVAEDPQFPVKWPDRLLKGGSQTCCWGLRRLVF